MSVKGNKNAEKWSRKNALALMNDALQILKDDESIFFIGELAVKLDTYRDIFRYFTEEKFKDDTVFRTIKRKIDSICESRLVKNSVLGKYNPTSSIFTLKNNHGWKDKKEHDHTSDGKQITTTVNIISPKDGI